MPEFIFEFFEYKLVIIGPKFEFRFSKENNPEPIKPKMVYGAIHKEYRRRS